MLIKGPGIDPLNLPIVTSMADIAPTIMEWVTGTEPESNDMDGTSFAKALVGKDGNYGSLFTRTATLIEYVSESRGRQCSTPMAPPAPQNISCHWHNGGNNSFSALRIISPTLGSLLYAEFVDGHLPQSHFFPENAINFYELYNVSNDYYMLQNIYNEAPKKLTDDLHEALHAAIKCQGRADCNRILTLN